MFYHTVTVLLEYIDCLLIFFTKLMFDIVINVYFTLPYYAGIMLNAFNDPLCSKLCWHDRWVPINIVHICKAWKFKPTTTNDHTINCIAHCEIFVHCLATGYLEFQTG